MKILTIALWTAGFALIGLYGSAQLMGGSDGESVVATAPSSEESEQRSRPQAPTNLRVVQVTHNSPAPADSPPTVSQAAEAVDEPNTETMPLSLSCTSPTAAWRCECVMAAPGAPCIGASTW